MGSSGPVCASELGVLWFFPPPNNPNFGLGFDPLVNLGPVGGHPSDAWSDVSSPNVMYLLATGITLLRESRKGGGVKGRCPLLNLRLGNCTNGPAGR